MASFEKSVFINCPFDDAYLPLLRPLLFTVLYLGFEPRIALEINDSSQLRLKKIVGLIETAKYSIHDLSRSQASHAEELYRLNMPFELGIDYGCKHFGSPKQRQKVVLILETEAHQTKKALSDLAGVDVQCHTNAPYQIFTLVKNWLSTATQSQYHGPQRIADAFDQCMQYIYTSQKTLGCSDSDIEQLTVAELIRLMRKYCKTPRV